MNDECVYVCVGFLVERAWRVIKITILTILTSEWNKRPHEYTVGQKAM